MHTCRWVLKPYARGQEAVYCCAPVSYTLKVDDDGNKKRKYNTFCAKHQKLADLERD